MDRVAIAREKMDESKNQWVNTAIDFSMSDIHNKYVGCVTKRVGVKHINENKPCQDSCCIKADIRKEFTIVAIGDGHGDKSHDLSEFGSKIACEQLCEYVSNLLSLEDTKNSVIGFFTSAEFKMNLVDKWKEGVLTYHRDKFGESGSSEADNEKVFVRYGTTLLFAFAFKGFYYIGQLGDGGIVILNNDDAKCRIHKPMPDKKVGGGTDSLCMNYADAFMDIKVYPEEECSGIVLMTDGYFDPWPSKESLLRASKFFADTLTSTEFDCDRTECAYTKKYNEDVDNVSDDISIGILLQSSIKPKVVNNIPYTVSNIRSSCNRTTYTLSNGSNGFKVIFSNNFKSRNLPQVKGIIPLPNIICPSEKLEINNLPFYLYQDPGVNRLTLDDYCEDFILRKKYGMNTIMSIKILINILQLIVNARRLFESRRISLLELSDMIEFSPDDGSAVIYWIPPSYGGFLNGFIQTRKIDETIVAKYIINFLAAGKLFYDGKVESNSVNKDSFIPEGSLYEANLKKYPDMYIKLLIDAVNCKNKISIEKLLGETIRLQEHFVCCSNCGRISFFSNNSGTCECGNAFEKVAVLRGLSNTNNIIPVSANTVVYVYDSNTTKYEKVIEIIKNNENRIGFKNVSNGAWKVTTDSDEVVVVDPYKIKDISNCKSIKINEDEYKINPVHGGV